MFYICKKCLFFNISYKELWCNLVAIHKHTTLLADNAVLGFIVYFLLGIIPNAALIELYIFAKIIINSLNYNR